GARRCADPVETTRELRSLGVDAVGLANRGAVEYGREGLEQTFQALSEGGIQWFGAGETLDEAKKPHRVELPDRLGGGEIHIHGSYQFFRKGAESEQKYASADLPGAAPLKRSQVTEARDTTVPVDTFQVAFPNWGDEFEWNGTHQYRLAHR